MQKSNTNQIIQGRATFKKGIKEKLIKLEEIRDILDKNQWRISN